jgi:hypothetical protein
MCIAASGLLLGCGAFANVNIRGIMDIYYTSRKYAHMRPLLDLIYVYAYKYAYIYVA